MGTQGFFFLGVACIHKEREREREIKMGGKDHNHNSPPTHIVLQKIHNREDYSVIYYGHE